MVSIPSPKGEERIENCKKMMIKVIGLPRTELWRNFGSALLSSEFPFDSNSLRW